MISFPELYQKLRNDTSERYVICLDPGETTGFAIFDNTTLVRSGQLHTVENGKILWDNLIEFLTKNVDTTKNNYFVCENYRIYQHKLARHSFSPVVTLRLIGGIDLIAHSSEIPIYYQMAAQAKGFVTDQKLKDWGFWIKGKNHARDAIRHGIYFLLFNKEEQL